MPKIELDAAPVVQGTRYPAPYREVCQSRRKIKLGDAIGLTQFGVNLLRLPPGEWSSQRHWHAHEDEFVYVLEGEVVLVAAAGETTLGVGDCAGFRAGDTDAHCLQNRSGREAVLLEVGTRRPGGDEVAYPDIDLHLPPGGPFSRKDGTPY